MPLGATDGNREKPKCPTFFVSLQPQKKEKVLDGKLYAYQRGETSLLEVLNAQHTYNEIQEAYAECLHDCMVALTELQRAAGI